MFPAGRGLGFPVPVRSCQRPGGRAWTNTLSLPKPQQQQRRNEDANFFQHVSEKTPPGGGPAAMTSATEHAPTHARPRSTNRRARWTSGRSFRRHMRTAGRAFFLLAERRRHGECVLPRAPRARRSGRSPSAPGGPAPAWGDSARPGPRGGRRRSVENPAPGERGSRLRGGPAGRAWATRAHWRGARWRRCCWRAGGWASSRAPPVVLSYAGRGSEPIGRVWRMGKSKPRDPATPGQRPRDILSQAERRFPTAHPARERL